MILGIIELIRNRKVRKKLTFQSKAEKTTKLALCPEEQAEEVLRTISVYRKVVKYMLEKIKRFFKYIYSNKETIINTILNLALAGLFEYYVLIDFITTRFTFLNGNMIAVYSICGVLTIAYMVSSTHAIAKSCGWETPEQFNARLLLLRNKQAQKLDKDTLKAIKEKIADKEKLFKDSAKKVEKATKDIDILTKLSGLAGYQFTDEDATRLQEAKNIKFNEEVKKEQLATELDSLKVQVKK